MFTQATARYLKLLARVLYYGANRDPINRNCISRKNRTPNLSCPFRKLFASSRPGQLAFGLPPGHKAFRRKRRFKSTRCSAFRPVRIIRAIDCTLGCNSGPSELFPSAQFSKVLKRVRIGGGALIKIRRGPAEDPHVCRGRGRILVCKKERFGLKQQLGKSKTDGCCILKTTLGKWKRRIDTNNVNDKCEVENYRSMLIVTEKIVQVPSSNYQFNVEKKVSSTTSYV